MRFINAHWQMLAGVLCALFFPIVVSAQVLSPERSDQVDQLFETWNRDNSPGAAVAIIQDGQIIYQNAYGMADLERNVTLSTQSAFEIGSISKQFTAMCVLLLESDGLLSLDDNIRSYIPELPTYEKAITLRHLLHHTSGIRDIETLIPLAGIPWVNYYSVEEQIQLIARQQALNFPPNSRFLYSNSGYLLLAQVVERVSGQPLRQFAEERVFEPLGMHNTVFWDHPGQIVPNRALAYMRQNGDWLLDVWNLPFPGPAGVHSTVGDLALWDANFYDNHLGGGAELIKQMETVGVLDDGEKTSYGLGLDVDSLWNRRTVWHSGAWMGYRAFMARFPEEKQGVILLTNGPSIAVNPGQIVNLAFSDNELSADEGIKATNEQPEVIEIPEAELLKYEGTYLEEGGLVRTIEVRDGSLYYVRGGGNDTNLAPFGEGQFFFAGIPHIHVVFDLSAKMMRFIDNNFGYEMVFNPLPLQMAEIHEEFTGFYWSDELGRELQLKTEGQYLSLGWTDEKKSSTAWFVGSDKYTVENFIPVPWSSMNIELVAERDETGKVAGLTLNSEMVSGVIFRRK